MVSNSPEFDSFRSGGPAEWAQMVGIDHDLSRGET